MNTFNRLVLFCTAGALLAAPAAFAQRQLGKKKGPTSKLYLAETVGEGQIITDGKAYAPRQATAFDAPGTVIETKKESHQAFVYSNGAGMFVDAETRVEVDRFVQEPFRPDRNSTTEVEPSISQSDVFVARGQVGICTGQLVSGTTMNYGTPHANVNIRGGKLSIKTNENETVVYLLEGDATVRGGSRDLGGQILRSGEQAVIRPGPPGRPPTISVGPIERTAASSLDDKVNVACNAKKSVSFETIEKKAEQGLDNPPEENTPGDNTSGGDGGGSDQEIVVRPTTPTAPPPVITVSPDRLAPGK